MADRDGPPNGNDLSLGAAYRYLDSDEFADSMQRTREALIDKPPPRGTNLLLALPLVILVVLIAVALLLLR